jgi:hypothetical protein
METIFEIRSMVLRSVYASLEIRKECLQRQITTMGTAARVLEQPTCSRSGQDSPPDLP